MKKITFFLMAMLLIFSAAFAQQTRSISQGDILQVSQTILSEPTRAPGDVAYFEGFETTSGTALPTGWTVNHTGTADSWISVGQALIYGTSPDLGNIPGVTGLVTTHTGSRMLALSWQQTGRNAWAISSGITLTAGTPYFVSFWLSMPGYQTEISGLECKIAQSNTPTGLAAGHTVYYNNRTQVVTNWTKISSFFVPATTGTYYLGFHDLTNSQEGIYTIIDDIEIAEPTIMNDLQLLATNPLLPYTKVPASQMAGVLVAGKMPFPASINAQIYNAGGLSQTNVTFSATFNGTSVGTPATLPTIAPTATVPMTITTSSMNYPSAAGNYDLVYNVLQSPQIDENPANNTKTFTLEIGNKFQLDDVTTFENGVGSNTGSLTLGNVFPIYNTTTLTDVEVAFSNNPVMAGTAYTISLFPMTNPTTAGNAIFTQTATRPAGGLVTVNVPATVLNAGDYFLTVNQLTASNIGVSYDTRAASNRAYSKTYSATGAGGALTTQASFGALAIRMITSGGTTPSVVYITATSNDITYGTVTGGGAYYSGALVTLTAKEKFGYQFVQWNDGVTTPVRTFTATANANFVATFASSGISCNNGEVIIGTNTTNTGNALPINTYYNHSYSQQIFTPAEIGINVGDAITEVSFQYTYATAQGPGGKINQTVFLGTTCKETFTSTSDWVPFGELQKVFTGTVTYNNLGTNYWCTIVFDDPLVYYGGNLVLAMLNNHGGYNTSSNACFRTTSTPGNLNRALHYQVDGTTHIDPATLATGTGMLNYRSNTKFGVCKFDYNVDMATLSITGNQTPMTLVPENYTVTVKNFGTTPANNYTVSVITAANDVLATATITTPLAAGATANHIISVTLPHALAGALNIKGKVTIAGDQKPGNNETNCPLVLNVKPHPGYELDCAGGTPIQVGTGTASVRTAPMDNWNGNSFTQQIYDASEIGSGPGMIGSISFNYTFATSFLNVNNLNVYLKHTTNTTFGTGTGAWIPVTTADLVFSGNLAINNGWVTFTFDTPFNYNGTDNIVVSVHKTGTYWGSNTQTNWQCTTTSGNKTNQVSADGTTYNPGGMTQTGTAMTTRPNARFTFCQKLYTLNPNNQYGEGAVVTVTSTPYPAPAGGSISVAFSCDDPCREITDVIVGGVSQGPITTYTFSNIQDLLPIMEVITDYKQIPITATSAGNGSIEPPGGLGGVVYVNCGFNQSFTFLPDLGYVVDYFEVNGIIQPKFGSYTFINVTEPQTITVYFKVAPYNIVFTHVGNGEVIPVGRETEIPNGQIGVDDGDMVQFLFVPDANNEIQSVYIDGAFNAGATATGSFTFSNISASHTVHVIFKLVDVYIQASAGANGTITPSGNVPVPYGTSKTFTISGNNGYVIDQVLVDFESITVGVEVSTMTYIFEGVVEPHTISATFKKATYIIEVTGCEGGTVNPVGSVPVLHNASPTFTFYPNAGFKVSYVLVDGVPYPQCIIEGEYTFWYVTAPHTLEVCFEPITLPIKATINGNGFIVPAGTTQVPMYSDKTYTFYAIPGYEITQVFVDGMTNGPAVANGTHTFTYVTAPHTIDVITSLKKYTIIATAGVGGFISPSGISTVNHGDSKVYTITAKNGYKIERVLVDGVENQEAAVNGSYAFLNVQADHTISVEFGLKHYAYHGLAYGNGIIDPMGTTEVVFGENITYTITPNDGFAINYVLVNGIDKGAITHYTFFAVEADGTVEAFFKQITGIEEQSIEGVNVYNTLNTIFIQNPNHLNITDISIFDMFGRTIYQAQAYTAPITIDVANGVYTVRVTADDNVTATKVSIVR